jgi:hypothetical protein
MKIFLVLSVFTTLLLANSDCNKKKGKLYKGKLEIAGICMNYTIRVVEGNVDTSLIAANWTDETTKKSYTNVFKLGNPCEFPATIKQGDEFYFSIDTAGRKPCAVCMAYYPTPSSVLSITIAEK